LANQNLASLEALCKEFSGAVFAYDAFIAYPAPVSVPSFEVMKKVGSLLSQGFGMKVSPFPSMEALKMVVGSG